MNRVQDGIKIPSIEGMSASVKTSTRNQISVPIPSESWRFSGIPNAIQPWPASTSTTLSKWIQRGIRATLDILLERLLAHRVKRKK